MIKTLITMHPEVNEAVSFVTSKECGALALFIGYVRDHNHNLPIIRLDFEVYESLAKSVYETIVQEALQKWPKIHIYIAHAKGQKQIGDVTLIIAVSSIHRRESFQACEWLLESIKEKLPVWKCEYYADGSKNWLNVKNDK